MIQKINLLEKANSVSELFQYLEVGHLNNNVLNVLQAENRTLDFHIHEDSRFVVKVCEEKKKNLWQTRVSMDCSPLKPLS